MARFTLWIIILFLFLAPSCSCWAQHYSLENSWNTAGIGGIGVLAEDQFVTSNTFLGSVTLWNGDVPEVTATVWTNPIDASDTVRFIAGNTTGPRGVRLDPFGNVLTISNDPDHNILVWNSDLSPATQRLKTSLNTGDQGRIYAIDADQNGNIFTLRYYDVPAGTNRLEVYPPVIQWATDHIVQPISGTEIEQPSPSDAHEGMCVNAAGTVVWYTDRSGRAVHRMVGNVTDGYQEDSGFSLDLPNGSASAGFRGIALNPDETKLLISDNMDLKIQIADSISGTVDSALSFSTEGSLSFDIELDDKGNVYVAYLNAPAKVEKYVYVPPTPTFTPTETVTPTLTPTGTIYPTHTPTLSPTPKAPVEFRAVWISRYEWPRKTEADCKATIDQYLTTAANANFNAVMFQIRGQCDTLYPSSREPWSPLLNSANQVGVDPGYDPVLYAIAKAHSLGLEFHAYMNVYPVWSNISVPPNHSTPEHIYWLHCAPGSSPNWLCHTGGLPMTGTSYGYMCPGIPAVEAWVRESILDLVRRYDVDGVHFDRIRYPGRAYSDDPISLARFNGTANPDALSWQDWQRHQIDVFVNNTYVAVQALKPWVKMSVSAWGIYDKYRMSQDFAPSDYSWTSTGYQDYYQDTQGWLQKGIMDALCPMIYWNIADVPKYLELCQDFVTHSYGRHVYAGMATNYTDYSEISNEIQGSRALGAQGNTAWSYTSIDGNAYWDDYKNGPYSVKAERPRLPWKDSPTVGFIMGHVFDGTNVPLEDARLTLSGSTLNWLTSNDGFFGMANVPPGDDYTIRAQIGDRSKLISGVKVMAGQVTEVTIDLSNDTKGLWMVR